MTAKSAGPISRPGVTLRGENEMARKNPSPDVSRRKFLAGVAGRGAASTVGGARRSPARRCRRRPPPRSAVLRPTAQRDRGRDRASQGRLAAWSRACRLRFHGRCHQVVGTNSVYANPASSYRGIHESLITDGKATRCRNSSPACTRNPRSRWRTATTRSPASPRWCCATASSAMQRHHVDLQRLGRSRARHRDGRHRSRCRQRPPGVPTRYSG